MKIQSKDFEVHDIIFKHICSCSKIQLIILRGFCPFIESYNGRSNNFLTYPTTLLLCIQTHSSLPKLAKRALLLGPSISFPLLEKLSRRVVGPEGRESL